LNLVKNAVQACTPGKRVVISAQIVDRQVELTVKNPGPKLDPEVSGKMFDPFFTTREKGTGLGLALVKDIIFDHGGTIAVESTDDETVIRFRLAAARTA
jgi:signal transduction histidine kinase